MKINCGENIRRYRVLNNMSQTDLGNALGLKHGAISSWEKNRTEPNMGQIEKMCMIFGCKKSDLIEFKRDATNYEAGTIELIDLFSKATPEQRQAVLNLLRSFVPDQE